MYPSAAPPGCACHEVRREHRDRPRIARPRRCAWRPRAARSGSGGGRGRRPRHGPVPRPGAGLVRRTSRQAGRRWRTGPTFVRGDPLADPTRLVVDGLSGRVACVCAARSRRRRTGSASGRAASPAAAPACAGSATAAAAGDARDARRWSSPSRRTARSADVVALVARRSEVGRAGADECCCRCSTASRPGRPTRRRSVLADEAADPAYWPTAGWRTASPASQGMDGARLTRWSRRSARRGCRSTASPSSGTATSCSTRLRAVRRRARCGAPYASGPAARAPVGDEVGHVDGPRRRPGRPGRRRGRRRHARRRPRRRRRLPSRAHLDPRKRAMTLEDMLTMQSGLAWQETGYAYTPGSGNTSSRCSRTANWTRYVVDRPMAAAPGTTLRVQHGRRAPRVGGRLRPRRPPRRRARRDGASSARSASPAPAGLRAPEGVTSGGFGLALAPHDLAKLAFLYLHHGRWDGRQVVPEDWVVRSTTDHVGRRPRSTATSGGSTAPTATRSWPGLYGQLAVVNPAQDLVAVVTAHIPADVDASTVTRWLVQAYVLSAARDAPSGQPAVGSARVVGGSRRACGGGSEPGSQRRRRPARSRPTGGHPPKPSPGDLRQHPQQGHVVAVVAVVGE